MFATRDGLLTRQLVVVPYARIQSVRVVQGPLQRRLRLATVYADTAGGRGAAAQDRDLAEAWALAAELTGRARAARPPAERAAADDRLGCTHGTTAGCRPAPVRGEGVADTMTIAFTEIGEQVYLLRHPVLEVNATLVVGDGAALLVDTLSTAAQAAELAAAARAVTPYPWSLVNTHHHFDHCFGNATLAGEPAAPVYAHQAAAARLREHPELVRQQAYDEMRDQSRRWPPSWPGPRSSRPATPCTWSPPWTSAGGR